MMMKRILKPIPVALVIYLISSMPATAAMLTYGIDGAIDFALDSVTFSGSFSYDSNALDQLSQTNAGRFALIDWNVTVDVNNGSIISEFNSGSGTASISQGINPTQIIFSNYDLNQFGLTIDFVGADLNIAPIFPYGTAVTYGFVEGAYPNNINDHVTPIAGISTLTAIPIPAALWLFISGLIPLTGFLKRYCRKL